MSVHPISGTRATDAVTQARIHLAAANRLAVFHELDEGIDNHFTMTLPGHDDRYLILPFGRHWSEARASDLMVFDESGATLEGEGTVELSAQCIHAPIHRICGVNVVLHTHQTWAVALNMLQRQPPAAGEPDRRLLPRPHRLRRPLRRHRRTLDEGERLAALLGDKHVMFMKNHGVLVVGDTVAAGLSAPVQARAGMPGADPGDEHRATAAGSPG